jgi:hypothetical protein
MTSNKGDNEQQRKQVTKTKMRRKVMMSNKSKYEQKDDDV